MTVRPEKLAAASRALQPMVLERLALVSGDLERELGAQLGMVFWDRIRLLGQAQGLLQALREARFHHVGGAAVHVVERASQPLEALELAWRFLRQGRPVHVSAESGACGSVLRLIADLGGVLGDDVLTVSGPGEPPPASVAQRELVGVPVARSRVAVVHRDGDREVAAYALARACLRRTGFDPRAIHRVLVVGPAQRLERHVRRLFSGARMGPVEDDSVFAGPVRAEQAQAYDVALRAWREAGVRELCEGGTLLHARASADDHFLAPAVFVLDPGRVEGDVTLPATAGPMLVIESHESERRAEERLDMLAPLADGHLRLRVGEPPREATVDPSDRVIRGALLVERLPPGLPEPRP